MMSITFEQKIKMNNQTVKNQHIPVMLNEVLQWLNLEKAMVIVDGTLGLGGYSEAILKFAPEKLKVIGFELDEQNLSIAKERLRDFGDRILIFNRSYSDLTDVLNELEFSEIDGLVLDLGIASTQVDNAEKGFSFNKNGPLDMRFSKKQGLTAAEIVNKFSEKEMIRIFRELGEEKQAARIARLIVEHRRKKSFETTADLAELIEANIRKEGKIHPATKVFQALRIVVNHELENLVSVLNQSVSFLRKGGRIVVVSYHSLEDRIVKNFFREASKDFINEPDKLTTTELKPTLKILTKKPLTPTAQEIAQNQRSRSAVMRVAEKI